mmetsp:Transcript_47311/g.107245  ORF Transcript_47311/g.107245 Transcript_47311/m.107245 type:complete len:204 (+) Transcript_47311:514-1125(+)
MISKELDILTRSLHVFHCKVFRSIAPQENTEGGNVALYYFPRPSLVGHCCGDDFDDDSFLAAMPPAPPSLTPRPPVSSRQPEAHPAPSRACPLERGRHPGQGRRRGPVSAAPGPGPWEDDGWLGTDSGSEDDPLDEEAERLRRKRAALDALRPNLRCELPSCQLGPDAVAPTRLVRQNASAHRELVTLPCGSCGSMQRVSICY